MSDDRPEPAEPSDGSTGVDGRQRGRASEPPATRTEGALGLDLHRPYVVTGASSGIGEAVVELLRSLGASVVTVDLTPSPVQRHSHVLGDVGDTRTWDEVDRLVESASSDGAAGFIACAGSVVVGDLVKLTAADFEQMFRVNALGVLHGIQRLVPSMASRSEGAVVAVASVDALFVEHSMSAYATSKGALLQLVRSCAIEYARHGVRVNAVCPGAVDTPLLGQHLESTDDPAGEVRRIESATPLGRLLESAEIARAVVFLASPWASALSGAAIVADGGLTTTYDFRLEDWQYRST